MQQRNESLTENGITLPHTILILTSIFIVGVSIYLSKVYFEAHYPTGLETSTLCNISSYFNCNNATHSSASNIAGVPISLFSLMYGIFLLAGSLFPSATQESTNKFLSLINLAGCVFLLLYSLFFLGSLCPMCSIYYLLSAVVFFLFYKYSSGPFAPSIKVLVIYIVFTLAISAGVYSYADSKEQNKMAIANSLISQYYSLPNLGDPKTPSPYRLDSATEDFSKAPIRLSIFSDFECPACKHLSELTHDLKSLCPISYLWPA